jgi:hypothetical protein
MDNLTLASPLSVQPRKSVVWRGPKKNARCPGLPPRTVSEGLAGMAELRPIFPGGGQEEEHHASFLML